MYIRMNSTACFPGTKSDENQTNGVRLLTGKFYQVGEDVTTDRADQMVAAGGAIFMDSNDGKRAKEIEIERKQKLRAAYEQQVGEEIAANERKQIKRMGYMPAETAALTGKGVRA